MPRLSPFTTDKMLEGLFAEETSKASQARIYYLVSIDIPGAVEDDPRFRIVDSNYDVDFAGETYLAFPVKVNPASVNTDGTIDKTSIVVANVSRVMMEYVEVHNGLRNRRVSVKTVYENALDYLYTPNADGTVDKVDNPTKNDKAYLEDEYFIDTYTANEQMINFTLEPILDLQIRIPRRRYMTDTCYWKYMDSTTCKHDGTFGGVGETQSVTLTAGSDKITLGQLDLESNDTGTVTASTTFEQYCALMAIVYPNWDMTDTAGLLTHYNADMQTIATTGLPVHYAVGYSTSNYVGMKPTTGTLFTVGADDTRYSIMAVKTNVDTLGKTTGWDCTVYPVPAVSTTGVLHFVTCNKTLADCKFRLNVTNYGGFPGVSGSRRIML